MTLLRLKGKATPEYSETCQMLAVKMLQSGVGHSVDQVVGGAVVMVAAILIKYGSGADDVDTFADSVRAAIRDHKKKEPQS